MTKIYVYKHHNGIYQGMSLSGHAGYEEYGQDIVCAAISVLTINTINSIQTFTSDVIDVTQDEKEGRIELKFISTVSQESRLLMDSYILGIQGIEQSYGSKYLKLILKEV